MRPNLQIEIREESDGGCTLVVTDLAANKELYHATHKDIASAYLEAGRRIAENI